MLYRGALRAEVDEEGAGGRACPQLLQLIVMGPLDVAPLLDLRGGQDMLGSCQVPGCLPARATFCPRSQAEGTGLQSCQNTRPTQARQQVRIFGWTERLMGHRWLGRGPVEAQGHPNCWVGPAPKPHMHLPRGGTTCMSSSSHKEAVVRPPAKCHPLQAASPGWAAHAPRVGGINKSTEATWLL